MATINPIQMNQPVKALNSNQSMNGDSQESFIDQAFASFPDELEAAKGQSQNTSSSADLPESKPEIVENIDLQNLPVTAAVGVLNAANIAAAIQVMAPVDTLGNEVINLEQLQLASLTSEAALKSEQVVIDPALLIDTSSDAQLIAQNLVSPESLAIASQNIQNTLADTKAAEAVVPTVSPVISQVLEQSSLTGSESADALNANLSLDLAKVALNQPGVSLDQKIDTAELSVDSKDALNIAITTPVVSADSGLTKQLVSAESKVDVAAVDLSSKVQAGAGTSASSIDIATLSNAHSPVITDQDNTSTTLTGLTQQVMNQNAESSSQTKAIADTNQQTIARIDADLAVTNEAAKLAASQQVSEEAQVATTVSTPIQVTTKTTDAVEVQASAPVVAQTVSGLKLDAQSSIKVSTNQAVTDTDSPVQTQVASPVVTAEQVSAESSFTLDGKQITLSRDDLAQSEDILAARAENIKLAKSEFAAVQVDQLSAIDIKDFNKVDSINNGIIMTDSNRSTFIANANQEFQLTQAAPLKLEPHNVSLASGPLNIEVMRVLKEGGGRVIMEVTPPDQGTLQLDLRLDNQGKAILIVDGASDSTRARLEQGSAELRQQLADMGLQLSLNMRQKSDSEGQFRFASSSDGFNNSNNRRNDSSVVDQVGGIISNQINSDGRVHLYA